MRRFGLVAVVGVALVVSGCVTSPSPPNVSPLAPSSRGVASPSPTSASPTPTGNVLGKTYPLVGVEPYAWAEPLGSLTGKADPKNRGSSREGWRIDLMGVYRLAADRVLGEFRLNNAGKYGDLRTLNDPEHQWWTRSQDLADGYGSGYIYEFSDVKLTVAGDENTYLPVRTANNFCLCTMSLDPITMDADRDFPAYVVMTAPRGSSVVSLSIPYVGEFKDVAVSDSLPSRQLTALPDGYQLRLLSLSRDGAGAVTGRVAIERLGKGPTSLLAQLDGTSPWDSVAPSGGFANLLPVSSDGVFGGWQPPIRDGKCPSCTKATFPNVGEGVDVEITSPDPGSDRLLFGGTVGWLLTPESVSGAAARGSSGVFEYSARYKAPGIRVDQNIDLDTTVLFATDKATLTPAAGKVLDKAVQILRAQAGRNLVVTGHTDSTGTAAHNMDLSKRRAQAVKDGLASRLGSGWSFTVKGVGETQPKIKETGLTGADLDRARSLNRRVEISVAK